MEVLNGNTGDKKKKIYSAMWYYILPTSPAWLLHDNELPKGIGCCFSDVFAQHIGLSGKFGRRNYTSQYSIQKKEEGSILAPVLHDFSFPLVKVVTLEASFPDVIILPFRGLSKSQSAYPAVQHFIEIQKWMSNLFLIFM